VAVLRMDAFIVVSSDIKGFLAVEAYELSDNTFIAIPEFWRNFHNFASFTG